MTEGIIFLAVMAAITAVLLLLWHYFPRFFRHLVVWGSVAFALLMEWCMLVWWPFEYADALSGLQLNLNLTGLLHLLCVPLVLLLMFQIIIPPLRRHYSQRAARLLFSLAFSLLALQLVLLQDATAPLYFQPWGLSFSLVVLLCTAVLLLWQLGFLALQAHLDHAARKLRRQAEANPSSPEPCCKRPLHPKWRRLALCLLPLALLTPLLCIDWREPRPLPDAEAQRQMDEISARLEEMWTQMSPRVYKELRELLHDFACSGDVEVQSDELGLHMLHVACIYRKPALVQYLLEQGADPNAASDEDLPRGVLPRCPINLITQLDFYGKDRMENAEREYRIVSLLLEHGAQPNANSIGTDSPLNNCLQGESALDGTMHPYAERICLLLLEHGASLDTAPAYPYTYMAAQNGWPKALACMLERKAPMNRFGHRPLHGAATGAVRPGALECARLLLEAGEDVNLRSGDENRNAMMWLIAAKDYVRPPDEEGPERCGQMALLFIEAGARLHEPWGKDKPGKTIAEVLQQERPELAEWLEAHRVSLAPQP